MASRYIPREIIIQILTPLPIKTLTRFKCVCKTWKKFIESQEFHKFHLQKSLKIHPYNCSLILTIHFSLTVDDYPVVVRTLYRAYLDLNDTKLELKKLELPSSFEESPESIRRYLKNTGEGARRQAFGSTTVAGSCNGLILICSEKNHPAICNPSIEKKNECFRILPAINYANDRSELQTYSTYFDNQNVDSILRHERFNFMVFGFGYDSYSHCYKIVSLSAERAFIYSFMKYGRSWREIKLPDLEHHILNFSVPEDHIPQNLYMDVYHHGVATNNHLHWYTAISNPNKGYNGYNAVYSKEMILSLDLHNEEWGEVQGPDRLDEFVIGLPCVELGVLNGCLCLSFSILLTAELWIMKEYGVKESWTMLCELPLGGGMSLVHCTVRNEYLLARKAKGLCWYGPENYVRKGELHGCEVTREHYYNDRVTMCTESFVDPLTIDVAVDEESDQEVD